MQLERRSSEEESKHQMQRSKAKSSARFWTGWLNVLAFTSHVSCFAEGGTDITPDWFYPDWAATARFNTPVRVLDTYSALERYSLKPKEIGLKDLSRVHGHICVTVS
jgi:hypothetical protein